MTVRPDHQRITQIGTDGGLLAAPAALPTQGSCWPQPSAPISWSTSPISRRARELTVWNTAAAPFDGTWADPTTAGAADLEGLLPYPEVLRIRVVEGRRARRAVPSVLATEFEPVTRASLAAVVVRAIALVEQGSKVEGDAADADPSRARRGPQRRRARDRRSSTPDDGGEHKTRWRTVATRFEDTTTFFPTLRAPEVWRFINLTGTPTRCTYTSTPSKSSHGTRR